jgi:ParB/RepB/Spo0J family partition protein
MDRLQNARNRLAAFTMSMGNNDAAPRNEAPTLDGPPPDATSVAAVESPRARVEEPSVQMRAVVPTAVGEESDIALDQVTPSPYQPRKRQLTKKDVEDLMRLIAANGQTTPIIVSPGTGESEGKYVVHSGHRRCAALRFLGALTVRACIRRDLDDRAARRIALTDNLGREDLSAYDQSLSLRQYCEDYNLDTETAAGELGMSRSQAYSLRRIADASDDLLEVLREEGISARAADALVRIDAKDTKKAVRLAKRYAAHAVTLNDLDEAARGPAGAARAAARAIKDVQFKVDQRGINLHLALPVGGLLEGQKERVCDVLSELLGHIGVAEVHAKAAEVEVAK